MTTIIHFLLRSSADPQKYSATVKFALLGTIPYIMQALDLVCTFGHQCYSIDPSLLETIIDAIVNGIFYSLTLVSVIGTLWGAVRKLYRTILGENLALK